MYYLNHIQQRGFKREEAFRLGLLFAMAVFLYDYFQLPEGDWIFYTVSFIYMGGVLNGLAMQRAVKRFYGATGGMIAGFLIMGLLTYYDYRYAYLLPIFGVIAFWYLFITGEYGGFILFFMVFFMLFYDLTFAVNNELNLFNLIWARAIATVLGGLLIIGGEMLIYPHAGNALDDAGKMLPEIVRRLGTIMETVVFHCRQRHPMPHEYWEPLSVLNTRIDQFHDVIKSYALEPEPDREIVATLESLHRAMLAIYEGTILIELNAVHAAAPPDPAVLDVMNQLALQLQQATPEAGLPPMPPCPVENELTVALKQIAGGMTFLAETGRRLQAELSEPAKRP